MKVGIITKPNAKGQIVIPRALRKSLNITPKTPINIVQAGKGLLLYPINDIITEAETEPSYLEILKKTKGTWAGDDWEKTRKRRRAIELQASRKRKQTW